MPRGIGLGWNDKMDSLLGTVPDKILSEFFGCTYVAVLLRRKKLGIESYSDYCKGRTYEEKYGKSRAQFLRELRKKYPRYKKPTKDPIDYEEVSKYLSTHTNKQISEMFEISDSSITKIRRIYKIDSPKGVKQKKSKKRNDECFVKVMRHLDDLLAFVTKEGRARYSYKVLTSLYDEHMEKKRKANREYHAGKRGQEKTKKAKPKQQKESIESAERTCRLCRKRKPLYFFSRGSRSCMKCSSCRS